MSVYDLHGLLVDSPLDLDARLGRGEPDYTVALAGPSDAIGPPLGSLLAELHRGALDFWLTADQTDPQRLTLRYRGVADFVVARAAGTIVVRFGPAGGPGIASLLLAGSVLAHLLSIAGGSVLHASAVEFEGGTLAIAGQAGAGKSTLAALLCSAGASLVSDDTLRIDLDSPEPACFLGTHSLRLRDPAVQLAEKIEGSVRRTADAKIAVVPPPASQPPLPLAAILLPVPNRETDELRIERLDDRQALLALLGCQRAVGWCAEELIRAQFAATAALAARVPVLRATVPWGPPFDSVVAAKLLEAAVKAIRVRA